MNTGQMGSNIVIAVVSPPFCPREAAAVIDTVKTKAPVDEGLVGYGWTLKKLRQWVAAKLGRSVSHSTLRTLLKQAGLSWKKCKKLLTKANPEKRAQFIRQFQALFERMCRGEVRLLYVDESHFHQDMDLGYTWAPVGQPLWRESISPPLKARINWYGAYDFTQGQCCIWHQGPCNGEQTIAFLNHLIAWLNEPQRQIVIIWDGAPWHRSHTVLAAAATVGIEIIQLPGYSPDLNPIDGLWKWMRREITQLHCYASVHELFLACLAFIDRINLDPDQVIARLWPKFDLDPNFEKLLLST
jgi:transposase